MRLTLIYTDCSAKASGDFSAAGEVAYAIQSYYFTIGEDSQCILTSSKKGVKVFKNLYGNNSGLTLKIHDLNFEVVKLSDFVLDQRKNDVDKYVEVAFCDPAPMGLVAKIVDPLSTKVLMVGLPHYDSDFFQYHISRFPQSSANGLAHSVITGFGEGRIGVPIYQGPFEPIEHEKYCGITKQPYGIAYFKGGIHKSKSTLVDYLTISSGLSTSYDRFILIGDCELNLKAIEKFARFTKKSVEVCDKSTQTINQIAFNSQTDDIDITQSSMPLGYEVDSNNKAISFCLLERVPHAQMRSLLKSAQPFICSEGINTPLEAIAFGKIPFIQYMDNNEDFYPFYKKAFLDASPPDLHKFMEILFEFCIRKKRMSMLEICFIRALLNDPKFVDEYTNTNVKLVNNGPNPAKCMVDELHKPGKIDSDYQGVVFGEDVKKKQSSFLSNLMFFTMLSDVLKGTQSSSPINPVFMNTSPFSSVSFSIFSSPTSPPHSPPLSPESEKRNKPSITNNGA